MAKFTIQKVKILAAKVEVEYRINDNATSTNVMRSPDRPAPEFDAALQKLAPSAADVLEWDGEYRDKIVVKSVTFKEGGKKEGVVISGVKMLESGQAMVFNTPLAPFTVFNDAEIKSMDAIRRHATQFIEGGNRAQVDAFADADKVEAKPSRKKKAGNE